MTVGVAVLRGGDLGGSVADGFVAVGGDGGGELVGGCYTSHQALDGSFSIC